MSFLKTLLPYLIVVVLVLLLRSYIISPVYVNGDSMESTLSDREVLLLNKIVYNYKDIERFDIVVINYIEGRPLVKRIVGLPNEMIEYDDGKLFVDGEYVQEPFITETTNDYSLEELGVDKIPDDMYFVMGDNRDNSTDSRSIGLIKREDVLGKANFVIYPFNKFGKVK